jgi:hypothetical protein
MLTEMFAVMVVLFCTEYELTVIPVPLNDSVPVEKFVPVMVMLNVAPCMPVVGKIEIGMGAPDVIVNAPARVPVCASAFVTTTSRAVSAAVIEMEMLAVMVVLFWTEYELTVIPVPLNDNVPVEKFVPLTVTLPVKPCSSLVGEMLVGAGRGRGVSIAHNMLKMPNAVACTVPVSDCDPVAAS